MYGTLIYVKFGFGPYKFRFMEVVATYIHNVVHFSVDMQFKPLPPYVLLIYPLVKYLLLN